MENQLNSMDINDILDHLPHRYPFLLVDKVIDFVPGKSLLALKNVTYNEPQFTGHFPQKPILPGVLVIEALAQATGILAYKSTGTKANKESLYYLVGIDKARFKRPVNPGEQLMLKVDVIKSMRGVWKFTARATVDDKLVASAELMCAERDA
ncbi:MAG: 3-hydroxyacyl-ACP dehydratase FabZ [gamma proteobacterium symbiont of Taylorina sp.]|nr:3-hydroxyacyl-ACP dehydratase FabZ [gamma proteobacterium symbiont of Taylorina sp.]